MICWIAVEQTICIARDEDIVALYHWLSVNGKKQTKNKTTVCREWNGINRYDSKSGVDLATI